MSTLADLIDLRDPRVLGGHVRVKAEANHGAVRALKAAGADAIVDLQPGAAFDDTLRRAVQAEIAKIRDRPSMVSVHNAVGHIIDLGRVTGLWMHDGLGTMVQSSLASSRVTPTMHEQAREADRLRARLAARLPDVLASEDAEAVFGAFVLAAVLYDALLAPALIKALEDQSKWQVDGEWIRLRHREGLRGDDEGWRTRRWRLGSLTVPIATRWQSLQATVPGIDAALHALRRLLADPVLPTSHRTLMPLARAYWAFHLPPYLYDMASCAYACESLPDSAFARLVHGRRAKDEPGGGPVVRHHPRTMRMTACTSGQSLQLRALAALRACLRHPPDDERSIARVVRSRVADWMQAHGHIGGWVVVIAHWIVYATGGDRVDERGRQLRVSSVQRYLSSMAVWLVTLCWNLDPSVADEITLMDRLDALQAMDHQASAMVRHVALQEILEFAERFGGPAIDLADWWGTPPKGGKPRANLFTPREREALLRRLNARRKRRHSTYAIRRLQVMFELAYWCGIRWCELSRLRIEDVRECGVGRFRAVVLWVRASKTDWGLRALPLHQLLPPDVLRDVMAFVGDRRDGRFGTLPQGAFLFGEPFDPLCMPLRNDTHAVLQRLMRIVSGDRSIVFHALRHTACTYIALRLMLPPDSQWPASLRAVSPAAFVVPQREATWADWVTGRPRHAHQRTAALAALMGHIDALVSYPHYMHLVEIELHAAVQAWLPAVPDKVMAVIAGVKPASLRQQRWRKQSNQ